MTSFAIGKDDYEGFWGPRTAAVDWCESNYQESYYVAEFWNTFTSFPISMAGFLGIYYAWKYGYELRFYMCYLVLVTVGFGSATFHGTLWYIGQIFDEIPMVYGTISFLYVLIEMDRKKDEKVGIIRQYLVPIMLIYAIGFTSFYIFVPAFFLFFLVTYISGCLLLIGKCFAIYSSITGNENHKKIMIGSIICYVGGFAFFWLTDNFFCGNVRILRLHAWFHMTSAIGTYLWLVFASFERERIRGRSPSLEYNTTFFIPIPYVAVPSKQEKLQ